MEQALARLPAAPCHILDLGTGTGAIALALASERPDCEVTAVDVMPDAVALALRNAAHLDIANVTIRQSDWFSALAGQRFAMIVSNPPYIDAADPHLAEGDVRFEPLTALVAADQGLADLAQIIREGRQYLLPGGWMLLEHGWTQGEAVRALFREAGYLDVATCRDYGDNERLTLGRLPDMRERWLMNLFTAVLYLHIASVVVSVRIVRFTLLVDVSSEPAAEPAVGANCAALQRYAAVSQRCGFNGDNALPAVHRKTAHG